MQPVCIYLRKSRADLEAERGGEGETLARHEAALRQLAARQGLAVAEVYREIVSGESIAARPVMQRLLADVEGGRWGGVLVMEVERLARGDTLDQGLVAQAFRYSGARIITPLKTYDPQNEFDEEYFEFGLFMSRREYKAINRRMQRGRLASAREGKYVGSVAPYGYRRVKLADAKGFTLEPLAEQAEVVANIYHWFVHGARGQALGAAAIASRLNAAGVPAAKTAWTAASVRDILQNPVYCGKIRWKWRPVQAQMQGGRRSEHRPRRADCELADGLHPAIIEPQLWERAQRLFQARHLPADTRGGGVKSPLAGLVVCGRCGRRMARKTAGNSEALACTTPGCRTVSSPLALVETRLLLALSLWLEGCTFPAAAESGTQAEASREQALLRRQFRETRLQKERLHDLLERGVYDDETFRQRGAALAERAAQIERLLQAAQPPPAPAAPQRFDLLDAYFSAPGPAQKNELLRALLERAVYLRDEGGRWNPAPCTLRLYPKLCG